MQRQNPSAGRKRHKFQLREGGRQLVCHEVNLVLVPRCACLRLARFQLHTGAERHIADQDLTALVQLFSEAAEERRLRVVRPLAVWMGISYTARPGSAAETASTTVSSRAAIRLPFRVASLETSFRPVLLLLKSYLWM